MISWTSRLEDFERLRLDLACFYKVVYDSVFDATAHGEVLESNEFKGSQTESEHTALTQFSAA